MNMLLPTIILVVLGCLYAGSLKTPNARLCAVVCILVVILFLCYFQMKGSSYEHFNGYAPLILLHVATQLYIDIRHGLQRSRESSERGVAVWDDDEA